MSNNNLYNHLVSNIPNTESNRKFVKDINKKTKESNSIWRLSIRYRKPKKGHKYGYGGNLKCENANAFSVYIHDRRPYNQVPENQYRSSLWEENRELKEENESLKKELAMYKNPYFDWGIDALEEEVFNIKCDIVDRFLESEVSTNDLEDNTLKDKYNQLMEMILHYEENNRS